MYVCIRTYVWKLIRINTLHVEDMSKYLLSLSVGMFQQKNHQKSPFVILLWGKITNGEQSEEFL